MQEFELPILTPAQLALLRSGVRVLGAALYGGWQDDEIEIDGVLRSSVDRNLPALTAQQIDVLIRGIEALGTIDGWSPEEKEMKKLLHSVRHKP